jgi:hypothetical protein
MNRAKKVIRVLVADDLRWQNIRAARDSHKSYR